MRKALVLIHRYVGLAMALFLIIVSLTGSILAFHGELRLWLNRDINTVPVRTAPMLDPFVLRERAEALEPRARVDVVPLYGEPGEAYSVWLAPRLDPATGQAYELPYKFLTLNPYTGEKIAAHTKWEVSLGRENILNFILSLHDSLALGTVGAYVLGITALLWTIDCFVGFYLTLPRGRRTREKSTHRHTGESRYPDRNSNAALDPGLRRGDGSVNVQRSFWQRWKPAWLIKRRRFNYDLHRASGLWVWPMLFVLAWSSVAFNLPEVYQPVMTFLFNSGAAAEMLPSRDAPAPLEHPNLGWREARSVGNQLMQKAAAAHGFTITREDYLSLDREHGTYTYGVRSSADWSKFDGPTVTFDANSGALKHLELFTSMASDDPIKSWLLWLHMAAVFGLPMQIFVCAMGLIITASSLTGVIIWWRKRRSGKYRATRLAAGVTDRFTRVQQE